MTELLYTVAVAIDWFGYPLGAVILVAASASVMALISKKDAVMLLLSSALAWATDGALKLQTMVCHTAS